MPPFVYFVDRMDRLEVEFMPGFQLQATPLLA